MAEETKDAGHDLRIDQDEDGSLRITVNKALFGPARYENETEGRVDVVLPRKAAEGEAA